MSSAKICKGTLYKISGKNYCVGERKTRTSKRTIKRKTRTSKRKTRTSKRRRTGGAGDDDTKCCMCGQKVDKDHSLMPSECKIKYGMRAHRICEECWFKPETGFAIEGRSHKCPGCEKGLPLTHVEQKPIEVVDLTGDD